MERAEETYIVEELCINFGRGVFYIHAILLVALSYATKFKTAPSLGLFLIYHVGKPEK